MSEQQNHAERVAMRRRRALARRRQDGGFRAPVLPDDSFQPLDGAPGLDVTEVDDILPDLEITTEGHNG